MLHAIRIDPARVLRFEVRRRPDITLAEFFDRRRLGFSKFLLLFPRTPCLPHKAPRPSGLVVRVATSEGKETGSMLHQDQSYGCQTISQLVTVNCNERESSRF